MGAAWKIFLMGMGQVVRDGMLLLLLPAPFLMGAALRFILPPLDGILGREFNFSLQPWYPLSDGFLLSMTPIMIAMACAFIVLDERDEGVGLYYRVTPSGGNNYLAARIGLPMIWAYFSSVVVVLLFGLALDRILFTAAVSFIAVLQGILSFMLLVALSGNRVEGLALAKLTNIILLGLPVPWFFEAPYKYAAGFLPSYWIGEMILFTSQRGEPFPRFPIVVGTVISLIWIAALFRWFSRRT